MPNNPKKPKTGAGHARELRLADPNLAREAERYESPVPSREYILETLAAEGVPVDAPRLMSLLGVAVDETDAFARRLAAMERTGQIVRNRRGDLLIAERVDLIRGRVEGHADGFGFLTPDGGGPDMYLGPHEMKKVLHGDRVLVRETGIDRRGRPEGAIVEILEHVNKQVVGRLLNEHGVHVVAAENKRISQDILIPADGLGGARPGQVVVAELVAQPHAQAQPVGRIVEVLGNYADPGMEIEIALRKHDLPHEFSDKTMSTARPHAISTTPYFASLRRRSAGIFVCWWRSPT
jgi:ribonuclease R